MRRLRPSPRLDASLRTAMRQISARPEMPGAGASLLAGSLLLVLAPSAHGLTLGDINVRSALGQRLDASVPVRLGPGEALAGACVTAGPSASDLRRVPGARVSTPKATREGQYELRVSSESALYEPMYELELTVKCPGAALVVRQYVLMLDLPGAMASIAGAPASAPGRRTVAGTAANVALTPPAASLAAVPSTAVQVRAARPRATANRGGPAIAAGSVYRVSDGDTLSGISSRVADRKMSLRALAEAIQAANPDAFIRNDPNLIKLGSEITIPEAGTVATADASRPAITTAPVVPLVTTMPPAARPPAQDTTAQPAVITENRAPVAQLPAEQIETTPAQAPEVPAAPARVTQRPAARRPAAAPAKDTDIAAPDAANPFVAAGAGILFGLCISAFLWFRGRLPFGKREISREASPARPQSRSDKAAPARVVAPLVTRTVEPGFSVSYSAEYDESINAEFSPEAEPATTARPVVQAPPAAAPVPSEEITSELEKLFDGTDTTIRKRLDAEKYAGKAAALRPADRGTDDVLDDFGFAPGDPVDFLVGDVSEDHDDTLGAQTKDLARPDMGSTSDSGTVDIHALASASNKDEQQAQTLLEALTLLERDYEEELTASQVLDMSAVRKALGDELDESTLIGAALSRKKAR